MNRKDRSRATKRLATAVLKEAVDEGFADLWDPSWNPKAHVNITLTIAEVRCAAAIVNYHPIGIHANRNRTDH